MKRGVVVWVGSDMKDAAKGQKYNLHDNLRFGDWRKLDDDSIEKIIHWLWKGQTTSGAQQLIKYVQNAKKRLKELTTDSPES